jgi:hypothetical protein
MFKGGESVIGEFIASLFGLKNWGEVVKLRRLIG